MRTIRRDFNKSHGSRNSTFTFSDKTVELKDASSISFEIFLKETHTFIKEKSWINTYDTFKIPWETRTDSQTSKGDRNARGN